MKAKNELQSNAQIKHSTYVKEIFHFRLSRRRGIERGRKKQIYHPADLC